MARNDVTVHVQLRAVSGLATCGVCSTLISFEVPREELERFERVTCPRCRGTAEIHESTLIPVLEVTSTGPGGLE
jgi:hypothetical protein